ncbi:MAG: hypothetical protein ACON5B_08525 [Myxococcota bacterium]
MRLSALLALAVSTSALAVQPPETTWLGMEPHRVQPTSAAGQTVWSQHADWQQFLDQYPGWEATFDEVTGQPIRAWGPPIFLGQDPVARLKTLIGTHPDLFDTARMSWSVTHDHLDPDDGVHYVDLHASLDGVPVINGRLTTRIVNGRLVMFGVDTLRHHEVSGQRILSSRDAIDALLAAHPHPNADHLLWPRHDAPDGVRLVWLPTQAFGKAQLRLAWEVRTETTTPVGQWVGYIDAEDGQLLNLHNEIRFFEGTLYAEHDDRLYGGTEVSPLSKALILPTKAGQLYTDEEGFVSFKGEEATVSLTGLEVDINDVQGNVSPVIPEDNILRATDYFDRAAPLSSYVFQMQVKEWGEAVAPSNTWVRNRTDSNVNINQNCNAYFDGSSVNFYRAGGGCNNTGRLADVNYHEWGHGLHTYAAPFDAYDGSLGEGAADVVSFLITDDHRLAPNFFVGGGTLRDAKNNRSYPENFSSNANFIHSNGMIFSGAMWDLRENLRASLGEPAATDITSQLLVGALKGGPDIPSSFADVMMADDDDGDLSNGTPHICDIVDAFAQHGLGPGAGNNVVAEHTPPVLVPDVPTTLQARIDNPAPDCLDLDVQGGELSWRRIGETDWRRVPLDVVDSESVEAELPALPLGSMVEYYLELEQPSGQAIQSPSGGRIKPYTLHVGETLDVWCTDFEVNRAGFRGSLVSGTDSDGANDWQWGEPLGEGGDPEFAASGFQVWGNDLGAQGFNGEYQNEKHNRLTSPEFGLGHYQDVFLSYQRWLTVEDGVFDRATILADGNLVWGNWSSSEDDGTDHHLDTEWTEHIVPLGTAGDDGIVTITWEIESDGGLTFGGWTLDDVCLKAPATPANRLAITDLAVTRTSSATEFTWTHPLHAPVESVRIVRTLGRLPEGAEDGVVVYETNDVVAGEPASASIEAAESRKGVHYAAYGFDGEDWLPWTVLGYNAAAFEPDASNAGLLEGELASALCGCQTGPRGGWILLGLLPLAIRRRRVG